jgi:hypothetical protein
MSARSPASELVRGRLSTIKGSQCPWRDHLFIFLNFHFIQMFVCWKFHKVLKKSLIWKINFGNLIPTKVPDKSSLRFKKKYIGVWQGVAMNSQKFHLGPPCPALLGPAGKSPLKRPDGHFRGGPPAGQESCGRLIPSSTPHAIHPCKSASRLARLPSSSHFDTKFVENRSNSGYSAS